MPDETEVADTAADEPTEIEKKMDELIDKIGSDGQQPDKETPVADTEEAQPEGQDADKDKSADDEAPTEPTDEDGVSDDEPPKEPDETDEDTDAEPAPDADDLTPKQRDLLKYFPDLNGDALPEAGPARDAVFSQLASIRRATSRQTSKFGERLAKARTALEAGEKKDDPADAADAPGGGKVEIEELTEADLLEGEPAETVAKLNRNFAGVVKGYETRVKVLEERLATRDAKDQEAEDKETEGKIDRFFGALDAKEYPQFGKGRTADLDEDAEEREARDAVIRRAEILAHAYEAVDGKSPDFEELLQEAADHQTRDDNKRAERERLQKAGNRRRKNAVARPSARPRLAGKPTADERFNKAADDWEERTGEKLPP